MKNDWPMWPLFLFCHISRQGRFRSKIIITIFAERERERKKRRIIHLVCQLIAWRRRGGGFSVALRFKSLGDWFAVLLQAWFAAFSAFLVFLIISFFNFSCFSGFFFFIFNRVDKCVLAYPGRAFWIIHQDRCRARFHFWYPRFFYLQLSCWWLVFSPLKNPHSLRSFQNIRTNVVSIIM